ncbi:hypothetical protein HMPREF9444_01556, partial [Succinatimonas hippei YIT 12066]
MVNLAPEPVCTMIDVTKLMGLKRHFLRLRPTFLAIRPMKDAETVEEKYSFKERSLIWDLQLRSFRIDNKRGIGTPEFDFSQLNFRDFYA